MPSPSLSDTADRDLSAQVDELHQRLQRTAAIEQAKGILMGRFGIADDDAYAMLRRWSSYTNVKISRLSQVLTAAAASSGPVLATSEPPDQLDRVIEAFEARQVPAL